ncbi:MAG: zinc-dependent alcohol dehydrogenase family protein [Anaerolineae bacterium]
MKAMVLEAQGKPLILKEVPIPQPGAEEVLVKVQACGVCRTDLHILDGDLSDPKLPLIMGHEIVGEVVKVGAKVDEHEIGDRVGIPWLGYTDQSCRFCKRDQENLCENAKFTGYDIDGGYAEYTAAHQRYALPFPEQGIYKAAEAAPLLCAGLIGYRSYRMAGDYKQRLGLYGFGAAAHIIAQVAIHQGNDVYAFTRPGDTEGQAFARRMGAVWAGGSETLPPDELDAAIIFAPVGSLVPIALRATIKGGIVVCGGIHMSDIPSFPYNILWEERVLRSVANLTRRDGVEFLEIAPEVPVKTTIHPYPLEKANDALEDLREGNFEGAAVLVME